MVSIVIIVLIAVYCAFVVLHLFKKFSTAKKNGTAPSCCGCSHSSTCQCCSGKASSKNNAEKNTEKNASEKS